MTLAMMLAGAAMPVPPYNASAYLSIPTPDATGQTTHPSVLDMAAEIGQVWNGYRYWMAHTPYANSAESLENPCIVASHDGLTWETPDGLTNPIDPWPGGAAYNSDPDLVWDPESERMICLWRDYSGVAEAGNLVFCYSESTDGVTWTSQADLFALTFPTSGAIFSPAIMRVGAGDWRMWLVDDNGPSGVRTASTLTGTWSAATPLTFNGTQDAGVTGGLWHWDIIRHDGIFYGLVIANRSTNDAAIYAITSQDGIAWSLNTTPALGGRADWDRQMYRPTLTIGTRRRMRVWYSALAPSGSGWRIGHALIPLSEWPAPPA